MSTQSPAVLPRTTVRDGLALAAVLAATFMGQVDGFVITVAAPSIQRDLPASFGQVQLIGASYVLACAAGLTIGGSIGDRYGRRRAFLTGIAVFTLASLACGLAPNAEFLIATRFLQGAAAAVLVPQELALIRSMYSDDKRHAHAISLYGVVLGLGVICGLAGGGLLVHGDVAGTGWRSVFLINVPIGVLILAAGRFAIVESRSGTRPGLDLAGAGLTLVILPALLLPLVFGHEPGVSGWIWWTPVAGLAGIAVLLVQQNALAARGGEPLFPGRVLRARGVPTGLITLMTFFGGNAGLFLVFTYYVQTGLGRDVLAAGLMFVPLGIGFAAGSWASGRIAARVGRRLPIGGCLFLALALAAHLAVAQTTPQSQTILLGLAIGAVGLAEGLVVAPLIAGLFERIAPDDAGVVSGAAATATQFGLAAGYAAVGSWYGYVLGGTPGTAAAPTELAAHIRAYSAAIVLLIGLALITSSLVALRTRAPDRS